jgi:uncharacterized repeat protein (TIGR02543 family)
MKRIVLAMTMLLLTVAGAWADDYNPQNPPDPYANYRVTVSVSPSEAGYASGGGLYQTGQSVWLSTSANSGYTFQYWTRNGVRYNDNAWFTYEMESEPVQMVAVYAYDPANPADPMTPNAYRLYLTTNLEGSCTFNLASGAKHNANECFSVSAENVSPGFKFLGWYINEQQVNENLSFWYQMPTGDVTLTARFEYNPDSPGDPASSQADIDNTEYILGDANKDGSVTIGDIVAVVNIIAGNTGNYNLDAADANKDGTISVGDIVTIVNIISGNN